MNTIKFQRRAVATAVSAALAAGATGVAYAVNITGEDAFPKNQGELFLGAALTKLQITATGSALEALIEAKINYFDAADGSLGASVSEQDSDGTTNVDINIAVGAPAGVSYAVVTVDLSPSSDTVGTSQFAYVDNNGNMIGASGVPAVDFASEAEAIAAAQADPDGRIAIDSGYTGLNIVDAKVDQAGNSPEVVYVTFNADPVGVTGASVGAPNFVVIADNSVPTADLDKTVSNGAPGTPGALLDPNQKAFIDAANGVGTLTTALTAFAGPLSSVATGANLDDGAGNGPTIVTTIAPVDPLEPPAYAAAGEIVIASGTANDLYDGGAALISMSIRMNEEVSAPSWNASDDVSVTTSSGAAGAVTTAGVSADADGKGTILNLNVSAAGLNVFFIDPANGNLTYGLDRDSAEPVSVAVTVGLTPVALKLNPVVQLDADLAAQQAKAGVAQAVRLITQDANEDGSIDGHLYDFRQPVDLGTAPTLGAVSYPVVPVADLVVLNATAPVTVTDSTVQVLLETPDVPNSDGTAPDTASNDYDGSGTVDAADAAVVTEFNLNTGVDNTLGLPGAGVPWAGFVGACSICAVEPEDAETSVAYRYVFDAQTGEALGVPTGRVDFSRDGAAPVVKSVGWTKTGSMACGSETVVYGVVTIQASEDVKAVPGIVDNSRDTINEFMFDGQGPDLLNDAACSPGELQTVEKNIGQTTNPDRDLGGDDDQILLSNVPFSVVGTDLSLGTTGGAVDIVPELPLFVLSNSDTTTVVEPEPEGPQVDYEAGGPEVTPILVDGNWTHIVVHYDQVVEAPVGQSNSDLNNVFKVRAQVGWDSSGSNTDDEQEVFQWIIAGEDVSVGSDGLGGASAVTLRLPNGEVLPEDTFRVWVDYQGASADDIEGGSLSYIQNLAGRPAKIDDGTQFDDDDSGAGQDVPMKFTSTGGTEGPPPGTTYGDTEDDEDTGSSDEFDAPFISLGGREDDQRNLFTQTVKGVITYDGAPVFEDTAVRADIVRLREGSSYSSLTQNAVVGDGYIDVRQGSNTEYNCNDCGDNWVTMAMKNSAVTGADFDKYAKDLKKVEDKYDEYYSAVANNLSSKAIDQLYMELQQLAIKFQQTWGVDVEAVLRGSEDGFIMAYVEVTHGEGTKAQDGSDGEEADYNNAMANGNASYGSTVTLRKNIPNVQRNGTRYYPVKIDMDDGEVDYVSDGYYGAVNVDDGQLSLIAEAIVGDSGMSSTYFEVVDTAYALTGPGGTYRVTVGMDEAALDKKSTGNDLQPEYQDACIMIKVKRTNRLGKPFDGEWAQANMCEPSFNSFLPFTSDLARDGTPTVLNVEMMNIKGMKLFDDGDWELTPVPGTPDRVEGAKDLALPWFFLQSRPSDGAPVTLWEHDGLYDDRVFALGLNEGSGNKKEPAVQLAFELGDSNDNSNVGSLNIRPGAALGFHGDGGNHYYADSDDNNDDVSGSMTRESTVLHRLFIPMTGGSQDGFLAGEAWHLVTFGSGQTLADIVTRYPEIDAIIMFNNPFNDYNAGRDDLGDDRLDGDLDTTVWFKGEQAPAGTLSSATGAFIYVGSDVDGFNISTVPTPTPQ